MEYPKDPIQSPARYRTGYGRVSFDRDFNGAYFLGMQGSAMGQIPHGRSTAVGGSWLIHLEYFANVPAARRPKTLGVAAPYAFMAKIEFRIMLKAVELV